MFIPGALGAPFKINDSLMRQHREFYFRWVFPQIIHLFQIEKSNYLPENPEEFDRVIAIANMYSSLFYEIENFL